jgi:hypothetical protein
VEGEVYGDDVERMQNVAWMWRQREVVVACQKHDEMSASVQNLLSGHYRGRVKERSRQILLFGHDPRAVPSGPDPVSAHKPCLSM